MALHHPLWLNAATAGLLSLPLSNDDSPTEKITLSGSYPCPFIAKISSIEISS